MSEPDAAPVLVCTDVTRSFDGGVHVLRGVSLSAHPREVVVIRGRTGAGKSTLLHILAGLDRPTSGRVAVGGQALDTLPPGALVRLRRDAIGIIFQSFNLLPSWTALENVEAAMMHTPLPRPARREKAEALLDGLGLTPHRGSLPSALSAGQQQLVAVARALANGPRLILADEPTGDVDPETAQGIVERLTALARDQAAALVVATHGPFPLDVATRALRLDDGRLAAQDPAPAP
jgi:putative ABC transport system ATP-binding protein